MAKMIGAEAGVDLGLSELRDAIVAATGLLGDPASGQRRGLSSGRSRPRWK